MSDTSSATSTAPAASSTPSAPSSSPSQSNSSSPASSIPTSPARGTTAELSDRLFGRGETSNEPDATSQHQAPSDYGWLDAYKDGVHGVPVQELLQSIANGQLPDALHDKLILSLKDGDQTWEGNVAQMRNGAMMREKFSRQMNELKSERDTFMRQRNQWINDIQALKSDPEQFLHAMQSSGFPVLEAAKVLASRLATRDYMNRQAGLTDEDIANGKRGPGTDWYEAIEQRAELNNLKRQQERQLQQQQQANEQKVFQQRSQAVQSAALDAFKDVGIDPVKYPQYWDRAAQHLQRIYDQKPEPRDGSEKPLTRGDVREAVRIVKEEIDAFMRAQGTQPPVPQAKPGAAALDTGAGRQVPDRAPKPASRKTTEEIAREMRERQGIRIR